MQWCDELVKLRPDAKPGSSFQALQRHRTIPMVVGILKLKLMIPDSHSLKGKRGVLKSIQARVSNQFNVSVTECGDHELWQSAVLGFAAAGTSQPVVEATLQKIVDFVDTLGLAELGETAVEWFHC